MRGMNHNMSASREKKKRQEQTSAESTSALESKKGMNKTVKTVLYAVIAVVLVAVIVFLGMVTSGFFITHTTAALVNGHKLTPAMVNYYYASSYQEMSSLLSYVADPNTPLDEQAYMSDEFDTWHDYLVDYALSSAASTYAIYDEAVANGYTLSESAQASLDSQLQMLELYASMSGFTSADAYVSAMYGKGCNAKSFQEYLTVNYTAQDYASHIYSELTYSQDEIDAYYADHTGDFDGVTFRQFNLTAEADTTDENGESTVSEEALAAVEEKAKAMAEASQGNEQAFLDLCLENTAENAQADYDASVSTLRTDIAKNNCVEAIRSWLSDDARQAGDTTYIYNTTNGYYVLYFLEQTDHSFQLPNVRHILIGLDDTTDTAAMEEAKAEAEALLAEFLAGNATEEDFAALANEKSTDTGSNTNGGLYENITPGSMADTFDAWCFDETRQPGDTGIVETQYGYHIMYFSGYGEVYQNYLVESKMAQEDYTAWQSEVSADLSWELYSDKYVTVR